MWVQLQLSQHFLKKCDVLLSINTIKGRPIHETKRPPNTRDNPGQSSLYRLQIPTTLNHAFIASLIRMSVVYILQLAQKPSLVVCLVLRRPCEALSNNSAIRYCGSL